MAEGDSKQPVTRARFGEGFIADIWHFACLSAEVRKGAMARHEILGEPVLIGRDVKGRLFALRDICPHRAAPLSAGRQACEADGATSVECPYHGWRFRTADGACAAIPSLGEGQTIRAGVRTYSIAESQGMVFVWMAGQRRGAPDMPPPIFPGVVGGKPKIVERMVFDAHIDHAVVGLMDPAHGPFVHRQWWWRSGRSMHLKEKRFGPAPFGFSMLRHAPSKNSRIYALLGGAPQTEITFRLPSFRYEHVIVGKRQVLALTLLTPVSATKTRITQLIWSDHIAFSLLKPFLAAGARRFLKQDADMIVLQNQGLKYDPPLLWIDDADRQAKWYLALKREWASARAEERAFENPVQPAVLSWRS